MLNIHELETKWLRYKIKSFIPHVTIIFSLLIIIIITTQFDFTKNETIAIQEISIENVPKINIEKNATPSIKEVVIQKTTVPVEEKQVHIPAPLKQKSTTGTSNNKMIIAPSLDFMQNMQGNSPHYYSSYTEPKTQKKKTLLEKTTVQKIKTPIIQEIISIPTVKTIEKEKITQIKIKRQNTQDDIQHVIKRFKTSNNPALSLFIAKKYYELENYNQSYNYALMTNELNSDIEESWIIFAKSLYKLNKKDKAIEILKKYISTSHSHRAKVLLDHMKTGKMK